MSDHVKQAGHYRQWCHYVRLSVGLQSRDCRGSVTAIAVAFGTILASLAHLRQDVDLQKASLNFATCCMLTHGFILA